MKKSLTFLLIASLFIPRCGKNDIQAIPAKPEMFSKENYIGEDGYGAHYFKYSWDDKKIELKTNPTENFGIIPGEEYPKLDSLYIKRTKIEIESGKDVYTIVGIKE